MGCCESVHKGPDSTEFNRKSTCFGRKEESFLDSHTWLDSDCDDDFFSVKGDFTPSRGTTPNYQFDTSRSPGPTKSNSLPTERDKKLAQLHHKLQREANDRDGGTSDVEINGNQPSNAINRRPYTNLKQRGEKPDMSPGQL